METTRVCLALLLVTISVTQSTQLNDDDSNADVFARILKSNLATNGGVQSSESSEGLFEGDIMFKKGTTFDPAMLASPNGVTEDALKVGKWPSGTVPYIFRDGVSDNLQSAVQLAIDEFNTKTCVRFVPRTQETNYVEFFAGGGCYSYIGRIGGRQVISLGSGCQSKGVAVHEMMHAVGFWHEQSREDRDDHIKVFEENIIPSTIRNFEKYQPGTSDTYGFDYDKRSVMHYGNYAFSQNGEKTIESLSDPDEVLGQRNGMSEIDAQQINAHYNCLNTTTPSPNTTTESPTTTESSITTTEASFTITEASITTTEASITTKEASTTTTTGAPTTTTKAPSTTTTSAPTTTTKAPTTTTNAPTTTTVSPPLECKDQQPFCGNIRKKWCRRSDWMKENCKERCGLCPKPCEDKSMFCEWWARKYCNHFLYARYMKGNCAKSCGFCQ